MLTCLKVAFFRCINALLVLGTLLGATRMADAQNSLMIYSNSLASGWSDYSYALPMHIPATLIL
jgi:hypothetical protein